MRSSLTFQAVKLPLGGISFTPHSVSVLFPEPDIVESERLHLLAYIPWHKKFLRHVPVDYHDFFLFVLPHLVVRTTNVHTALSLAFVPELIKRTVANVDEHLITLAVILHDCGWIHVSHTEIADSLDYKGVVFTANAAEAKRKHTVHGHTHARHLLATYPGELNLNEEQTELICDIVLYHERPFEYQKNGHTPLELIIACEADRLWPYTHENFWLDTIRKQVDPLVYIENLTASLNVQFLTDHGQAIAQRLLAERRQELAAYTRHRIRHGTKKIGATA